MKRQPVILIFDVGKTNKKMVVFNEAYEPAFEQSTRIAEITDEDGFPAEDINVLTSWVREGVKRIMEDPRFDLRAVNFSAYGASFVYLDAKDQVFLPLYNYLKPFPKQLSERFYSDYGGTTAFATTTASPILGSLNSGMQLYRLRNERPELFKRVKYALHLPQYLSFILSGTPCSEITSVGCHTALWDFSAGRYHAWTQQEGVTEKLPEIVDAHKCFRVSHLNHEILVGTGLHDSSSALIPYLTHFDQPFVLLATGTWNISLNPFNHDPLTQEELANDCLCYITHEGKPVKASRLFSGKALEEQCRAIANHFRVKEDFHRTICKPESISEEQRSLLEKDLADMGVEKMLFGKRNWSAFKDPAGAYVSVILDLVRCQRAAINLATGKSDIHHLLVDGGFGQNKLFMDFLTEAYHSIHVSSSGLAMAPALGAALVMHQHWNTQPRPAFNLRLTPGVGPS